MLNKKTRVRDDDSCCLGKSRTPPPHPPVPPPTLWQAWRSGVTRTRRPETTRDILSRPVEANRVAPGPGDKRAGNVLLD